MQSCPSNTISFRHLIFIVTFIVTAAGSSSGSVPARPANQASKRDIIDRLLTAKEKSGKTFTQIGNEIGCTNFYTAALFHNQQQLKPDTAGVLLKAVPALGDDNGLLEEMKKAPSRRYLSSEHITDAFVRRLLFTWTINSTLIAE